jgi:hypothetical protein
MVNYRISFLNRPASESLMGYLQHELEECSSRYASGALEDVEAKIAIENDARTDGPDLFVCRIDGRSSRWGRFLVSGEGSTAWKAVRRALRALRRQILKRKKLVTDRGRGARRLRHHRAAWGAGY